MNVKNLFQQKITFLASTKGKLMLVGFLALFILLFLVIYTPFDMSQEARDAFLGYVLVGVCLLLFSQFVLRPFFRLQHFTLYSLILWCYFEVLLITYCIYLVYSPSFPTISEKFAEYYLTFEYVALVMPGPYLLFVLYLGLQDRVSTFQKVSQNQTHTERYKANDLLTLTGENEKVILAIKYHQLLYVKSSGNYLDIFYLKGNATTKEVVRMSLKDLEGKINNPNIIRTHRSYIVNKKHIASFKRTRKGYALMVQNIPSEQLPVSSGYKDNFEDVLQLKISTL
jgi:hypothetical protein